MQTKHIEKLEELINHDWGYNGKTFKIFQETWNSLGLFMVDHKGTEGNVIEKRLLWITERNLSELEFFGLKVVLTEKPKLSKEDKEFLEKEMYFARERNASLFVYFEKPVQDVEDGQWEANTFNTFDCFPIEEDKFPFITWESGKAWSKAELMELEVQE